MLRQHIPKQQDKRGLLFVVEGIDHVGKTTLVRMVKDELYNLRIPISAYSFPGKEKDTLGGLVYDIHHNEHKYFNQEIDAISLQLLHVAAHIDLIKKHILSDLFNGKIVILDRCWWSTYAYGIGNGVHKEILKNIIGIEEGIIGDEYTIKYFYIDRQDVLMDKEEKFQLAVLKAYDELVRKNYNNTNIMSNNGEIFECVDEIVKIILEQIERLENRDGVLC